MRIGVLPRSARGTHCRTFVQICISQIQLRNQTLINIYAAKLIYGGYHVIPARGVIDRLCCTISVSPSSGEFCRDRCHGSFRRRLSRQTVCVHCSNGGNARKRLFSWLPQHCSICVWKLSLDRSYRTLVERT